MINKVITDNHSYCIKIKEANKNTYFEIIARDLTNNTRSSITNLNFIISQLIEPIVKIEDYETTLYVSKEIGIELFSNAVISFADNDWIKYLELKLQEDKEMGEWS